MGVVMNLIQAQQRYIDRVNTCHPGHYKRVQRSASRELYQWLMAQGYGEISADLLLKDARDIAKLERDSNDDFEYALQPCGK